MKLFVYGTLKYPEIIRALTGKTYNSRDANLSGYKVVALKNKPYPGLIISEGCTAVGKLIEIDNDSYSVISDWEDTEYTPTEITVVVDNIKIKTLTFLHTLKAEQLLLDLDEENFKNKHLEDYINNRIPKYLNH